MARAGLGLYTNSSNGDGYNLVFHGTNQVQFLDDNVTWGNAYAFNWQVGTWYWFQLAENNGTLEGKVWAAGTAEPQNWMFQQTGWTDLTEERPALNGGSATALRVMAAPPCPSRGFGDDDQLSSPIPPTRALRSQRRRVQQSLSVRQRPLEPALSPTPGTSGTAERPPAYSTPLTPTRARALTLPS